MIGAGFIGQLCHLVNYWEMDDCEVFALAEYRPELRSEVGSRYGIPRCYESHHDLLRDPDVDAVVVVTPRPFTGPTVFDCLKAGKHVISEKPMTGTLEQAKRLLEAAEANDLKYVVGYMKRYDEGVQLAKRLFDEYRESGELGTLLFGRAHCYMGDSYCNAGGHVVTEEKTEYLDGGWPVAPEWIPDDLKPSYGAFVNCFSHNTNLLRYMFGESPEVEYVRLAPDRGQVSVFNFSGVPVTLETGKASNRGWDEVTEFFFSDGRMTLSTPPPLLKNVPAKVEVYKAGPVQEIVSPQCGWSWSFRRQAEAFVSTVRDGTPSLSTGKDAAEDLRLIECMWKMELE